MSDFSTDPTKFSSLETTESSLPITVDMTEDMRTSSKWAQFLGVIGMGVSILLAISCLIAMVFILSMAGEDSFNREGGLYVGLGMLVVVVLMIFYIFISSLLYKYGDTLRTYVNDGTQSSLEDFFVRQRKFWQTAGLTTAIFLAIYLILIAFTFV